MLVMERITKLIAAGVFAAFVAMPAVAQDNTDPFSIALAPTEAEKAAGKTGISFDARNISLLEALEIICDLQGLRMEFRGNYVMLVDKNKPSTKLVRKAFEVNPEVMVQVRSMVEAKRKQQERFKRSDNPF